MHYKHIIAGSAAAALMLTAGLVALPALADTNTSATSSQVIHAKGQKPAAFGTVTAVSGNLITLTSKVKGVTTTYTVDASSATITKGIGKNTTTIAVSGVAIGDRLVVQGTVSGTTITATTIRDGLAAQRIGKSRAAHSAKSAVTKAGVHQNLGKTSQ